MERPHRKTCWKINSKIALLKRISHFVNYEMKMLFYNSYILTAFDYGCVIWGNSSKKEFSKVRISQKRAARIILNAPVKTPSDELFHKLNWLSFNKRKIYNNATLIYKILHQQTPNYLNSLIIFASNNSYDLRSSYKK
jgi:hypothetical protein